MKRQILYIIDYYSLQLFRCFCFFETNLSIKITSIVISNYKTTSRTCNSCFIVTYIQTNTIFLMINYIAHDKSWYTKNFEHITQVMLPSWCGPQLRYVTYEYDISLKKGIDIPKSPCQCEFEDLTVFVFCFQLLCGWFHVWETPFLMILSINIHVIFEYKINDT